MYVNKYIVNNTFLIKLTYKYETAMFWPKYHLWLLFCRQTFTNKVDFKKQGHKSIVSMAAICTSYTSTTLMQGPDSCLDLSLRYRVLQLVVIEPVVAGCRCLTQQTRTPQGCSICKWSREYAGQWWKATSCCWSERCDTKRCLAGITTAVCRRSSEEQELVPVFRYKNALSVFLVR